MVIILDSTLREGELQPGVYYNKDTRVQIARALAEVGTKRIEFPIIYTSRGGKIEDVKTAVNEVQDCYTDVTAVLHMRALKADVEIARAYDATGCAIYMAPTAIHRKGKFHGIEQQRVIENFVNVLDLIKDYGFSYRRATVEDASRFDLSSIKDDEDTLEFLGQLLKSIEDAGATVVSIPDTSGILPQNRCIPFIKIVKNLTNLPLACHFHNDYGNALGNALQVLSIPNVQEINVSILGLGARNGITDHYAFVANAEDLYNINTGEKRDKLRWLYDTFVQVTGIPIPMIHPLASQCFMEKAGTHQSQVIRNPRGYIPTRKFELDAGGEVSFEAGQYMSKQVIAKLFEDYNVTSEIIVQVTNTIAARSVLKRREVSPWEVKEIIEANSGINLSIDRINKIIKGSDYVYIMLSLIPQFHANELIQEVSRWGEVVRIDEVYGNVDVILLSRIKDFDDVNVVEKLRKKFKEILVKIVALPVE
jgi:isopropylmalate/homocitrate/citramalate synthase